MAVSLIYACSCSSRFIGRGSGHLANFLMSEAARNWISGTESGTLDLILIGISLCLWPTGAVRFWSRI